MKKETRNKIIIWMVVITVLLIAAAIVTIFLIKDKDPYDVTFHNAQELYEYVESGNSVTRGMIAKVTVSRIVHSNNAYSYWLDCPYIVFPSTYVFVGVEVGDTIYVELSQNASTMGLHMISVDFKEERK